MSIRAVLHRGKASSQAVLNAIPAQIAVLKRDGTIMAVNEAWSQFAADNGAPRAVRFGIGINYLDVCRQAAHAGDATAADVMAGIQAVLDRRLDHFTFEYPCHSPTEQRWFEMSAAPLIDSAGGAVITHTNVTARVLAQDALLRAELLRAEIAREREIIDRKQRFISMVSHDLRSPLSMISLAHQVLSRYFDQITSEQRSHYLQTIETQVKHMGEMLEDVLTLSAAQAGKLAFNPSLLDLEAFCRDVFQQMQLTDTVGHQFTFAADGTLGQVLVDEKIVRSILINLLSNAIKYSPSNRVIHLELTRDEQHVILRITDQGIGIPEADQASIFEPFHRGQNARTITGTGLGLAIVRSNVEAHRGVITFESSLDKGTTFTVRLPIRVIDGA